MGKNENKVSTISPHYSHSVRTVTEIRAGMSSDDLREATKLLVAVWLGMSGGFSLPITVLKKHPHLQAPNLESRDRLVTLHPAGLILVIEYQLN